jgi:RecB family exonuclease
VGLPLQAAVIVGLVEGVLPARWRDDPLLPEHERDGVEALGSRRARALDQQADLFAVVAGVPHVVGTWARTDGDGRPVLASRFLAELAPPVGDPATDPAALPAALAPTSEAGLTLAELTRAHRAGRLDGHPFVVDEPALARALAIRRERRWGGFGPFEGRVGPSPVLSPPGGVELSPTALEAYAACPRRFLFEKVLEVEALDRPEEILELSAAHRGSLIHDVLERFVRQSPPPATPGAPWDADARARLHALVDEVGAEYEHQGLTGRPLLWLLGRRRILRDLDDFLQADLALRRTWGVVPQADGLELSFGLRDTNEAAVSFGLPDGQTVRFRGRIDRVDRSPDGRRLVVIDYKTGSRRGTERIREGVGRGTKLQLPIYGLAAAQRFPAEEVVSLYWFVGRRERFHQEPLHVDEEVLAALGRAVQGLVAGIAAGSFPARPGKPDQNTFEHCRWCDYDVACSPHRAHTWERLRRDPALADYVGLVEPEALVDQLALEVSDA